jgi:large subunit ribosomal protein L4
MAKAKIYEKNGSERGTVELSKELFESKISEPAIHQAVVTYLANQRQGTAAAKGRSEVSGGGKKPFRQKGTGRARAGTIRSPIWRGGGVVFGPHPRDYRKALPKKMKRLALRSSLSSRASTGDVLVVDDLHFNEPKTKQLAGMLKAMGIAGSKILFVLDKPEAEVMKSARNIPDLKLTMGNMVSTYDVMWADKLVVTESALKVMEEVFKP